ncbi:23S ribosomal RNA methyltransferase Erm [Candidatus Daviesbacteria bacterium]|nr:23S ribosomal RNA methyltransferase Erm [Candidatus Daviesbacteria bacterium]
MRKSIRYSQNFLKDKRLIQELVDNSSLAQNDVVFEIGSGKGIITEVLASHCKNVVAIESDPRLVNNLRTKFQHYQNVQVQSANILAYNLPNYEYKVFSNIPFNITADIIRKLIYAHTPPNDCYLIIQREAALKFAGTVSKETLFSVLNKPWYEFSITHQFSSSDFIPEPNVSIVLLRIQKRKEALITNDQKQIYKNFVAFTFNRSIPNLKKGLQNIFSSTQYSIISRELHQNDNVTPTQLTFEQWLGIFNSFTKLVDHRKQQVIIGAEAKIIKDASKIDKVHRTRVSKNWRQEGIF